MYFCIFLVGIEEKIAYLVGGYFIFCGLLFINFY